MLRGLRQGLNRPRLAIYFGVLVFAILFVLDVLWHYLVSNWLEERAISDVLEGIVITVLVIVALGQQEMELVRKERENAFLNHHIRNALSGILMASTQPIPEATKQQVIRESVDRILKTLKKMEGENVAIDEERPEQI
jgi:hypothetical protein